MRIDPDKMCAPWKAETMLSRLHSCRVMLACYDLLSDKQSDLIKRKIEKLANGEKLCQPKRKK